MRQAAPRFAFSFVVTLAVAGCISAWADDTRLEQSRALVKSFGQSLQAELKSGLADGGPAHAIAVCKDRAPQIASCCETSKRKPIRSLLTRPWNTLRPARMVRLGTCGPFQPAACVLPAMVLPFLSSCRSASRRIIHTISRSGTRLAIFGALSASPGHQPPASPRENSDGQATTGNENRTGARQRFGPWLGAYRRAPCITRARY